MMKKSYLTPELQVIMNLEEFCALDVLGNNVSNVKFGEDLTLANDELDKYDD